MKKLDAQIKQLHQAVTRLDEALAQKPNPFIRDSAIQRFEFCFDLTWKTIKTYLDEKKGVVCTSPKDCFRSAFQQGLIGNEPVWLEMTDARNLTVHTYNEDLAETIFKKLPAYLQHFEEIQGKMVEGK